MIAQANAPLDEEGHFTTSRVDVRDGKDIVAVPPSQVDYMDVSPKQVVSVAAALIPFLENDDANRALMGANMQRQAVPLLRTDTPLVGTGIEYRVAHDSGVVVTSEEAGVVDRVTADEIRIRDDSGRVHTYHLTKFARSNQGTCINQKPIVKKGQRVKKIR